METFLDSQHLSQMTAGNVREYLHHFVLELFQNHKDNRGYNIAFGSALQSDKALHETYKEKIRQVFQETAQKLRRENDQFQQIPETKLINVFIFLYNLVNAILYQHLSVMELFATDEKFVDYLSNLVVFSLKYYLETEQKRLN